MWKSSTLMLLFTPIISPASFPTLSPAFILESICSAVLRASSLLISRKIFKSEFFSFFD